MFKKRVLALFVILQVVVTSLFPASAYAATYAPVVDRDWNSTAYCVSGVSNRFDAALGLIGQWGKKIQISNEMYVKLSNESSGGAFWTLADSMVNPVVGANRMATAPEGWGLGPISTVLWLKIVGTCWAEYGSPADWMWCTSVNQELIDNANRDFLKVLNGESLGGGGVGGGGLDALVGGFGYYSGSTSSLTGNYVFRAGDSYYTNALGSANKTLDGKMLLKLPSSCNLIINASGAGWESFLTSYPSNEYVYCVRVVNAGNSRFSQCSLYAVAAVDYSPSMVSNGDDGTRISNVSSASTSCPYVTIGSTSYSFDGTNFVVNSELASYSLQRTSVTGLSVLNPGMAWFTSASGGGGGGGGDNHWPEPTTPEPDPPTNTDPPLDPPNPPGFTVPGIDLPDPDVDIPVTIVPPDNTTAADYTPWLRAILTALNTIIDDMGEHCDHIRVAMRDYLNGLYEALSDDLQAYYDDLTDYMSDLAKWIVSHLNFDIKQPDVNVNVPGYDDSSVIGWLRRIYYKLRGTGTPRPDPIEDTDGAFDWWSKFLEWITNALGGLLTDFVGDLGGFLQELMDTFPFSIPWDIVAMLTLLDAQRATPDVTFTIPGQNGWWNDITIRINLAAYDDAMATVRGMVLIWWMYILVMKTDWMMLLFDGANNAIGDFVSRLTGKG